MFDYKGKIQGKKMKKFNREEWKKIRKIKEICQVVQKK